MQLDKASMSKYCFNSDGEAWSLAHGRNGAVYLQAEEELFKGIFSLSNKNIYLSLILIQKYSRILFSLLIVTLISS